MEMLNDAFEDTLQLVHTRMFFLFEKPFIFILHHPVPHVIVKLVYCNDVFIYGWKLELKDWKGMISAYSF